jgi:DNA-binding XRE family transcriptional regulator
MEATKYQRFGLVRKVKERRVALDLNQPQAAVKIGIGVFTLRQFEMGGVVSDTTLDKIRQWLEKV